MEILSENDQYTTYKMTNGMIITMEKDIVYNKINMKKPNQYNPGSILEIEYKLGNINFKELFIVSKYMTSLYLCNLKTGDLISNHSDSFGKDYSNITNIIVKKEV